jgi:hypothetical protein
LLDFNTSNLSFGFWKISFQHKLHPESRNRNTVPKLAFSLPEISEEGLFVNESATPDELGLSPDEACAADQLSINARLTKAENRMYVDGDVIGIFERECVRCPKEYAVFSRVPFSVDYDVGEFKRKRPVTDAGHL